MTLLTAQKQPRLTGADWIAAALEILVTDGVEALQITTLAKLLGVTRGSFYWHFDSHEALLDALIAEWRARNTGVMVEAIADAPSIEDGILALFSVWVDHTRFDPRLDQAVRDWARRADGLRTIVKAEDDARVAAITTFFERFDYPPSEAFIRARVIYFTQVSYDALDAEEGEDLAQRMSYLEDYFLCFTGHEMDADKAAAYRAANRNWGAN